MKPSLALALVVFVSLPASDDASARAEVLNATATRPLYSYTRKNLYAVGVGENPGDVVTIINGNIHVARVSEKKTVVIDDSFKNTASKLKYTNVALWTEVPLPPEVKTRNDLNVMIDTTLKKFGYENPGTVPFLLKGQFPTIDFHVGEGDARQTFQEKKRDALIVGFFTKKVTADEKAPELDHIFHVVTQAPMTKKNSKPAKFAVQSGVIDAISFGPGPTILFLPR